MKSLKLVAVALIAVSCTTVPDDTFGRFKMASGLGEECGRLVKKIPSTADEIWPQEVRTKVESAFNSCLNSYLLTETHSTSLEFFQGAFKAIGIDAKIDTVKNNSHLVAQVNSPQAHAPSVLLINPTDLYNGQLINTGSQQKSMWGQKRSDVKSIGILQLFSMAYALKQQKSLDKNLVFVSTETGEIDNALTNVKNAQVILNEGGYGFATPSKTVFLIGSEQKGGAWLKIRHENAARLLSHLDQLMAVFLPHDPQDFKEPGKCRLVTFNTEQPKINSIPYKVDIELSCKGVTDLMIGQAFAHRDVSFLGKNIEGNYFISLEISHPGDYKLGELSALQVAAQGLQKLSIIPYRDWSFEEPTFYKHVRTPASVAFAKNVKTVLPSSSPWSNILWELDSEGEWSQALSELPADKKNGVEKLFRTSCHWTGFEVNNGGAEAFVDCRLAQSKNSGDSNNQADSFIKYLKGKAKDPTLSIELVRGWNYSSSETNGSTFEIMKKEILKQYPKATISPWMAPVSLSLETMSKKIPSYGFYPLVQNEFIDGEGSASFPMDQMYSANQIYTGTVAHLLKN